MRPCLELPHCAHFTPVERNFFFFFPPLFKFASAGDISGAVQTLRALLLFYPSDKDSLDNLQLYSETLGGDTESQGIQPSQVRLQTTQFFCSFKHLTFSPEIKRLILSIFGMLTICWCHFNPQEISQYVRRSLQEKKLLYYGMENLDFTFYDPVSAVQQIQCLIVVFAVLFFCDFSNYIYVVYVS